PGGPLLYSQQPRGIHGHPGGGGRGRERAHRQGGREEAGMKATGRAAPPLQVEKLSKYYEVEERRGLFRSEKRRIVALKDFSLKVGRGEIFGLLGPNGAGKTTLIKCLTTLLVPSSGTARVNGYLLGRDDRQIRATIGCMLMGERGLYWKLTGR